MKKLVLLSFLMFFAYQAKADVVFKENSWLPVQLRSAVNEAAIKACPLLTNNKGYEVETSEPNIDEETGKILLPSYYWTKINLSVQVYDEDGMHFETKTYLIQIGSVIDRSGQFQVVAAQSNCQ